MLEKEEEVTVVKDSMYHVRITNQVSSRYAVIPVQLDLLHHPDTDTT